MATTSEDVTALLNKSRCYCLNEAASLQFNQLFCGDHTLALKSDTDEQLLLHLEFRQTVSLRQIQIGIPGDDSCPRTVKLFVNRANLDFSEVSDIPVTQELTLTPAPSPSGQLVTVALHATKWQRTDSITLFVEDNHGAEASSLFAVKLFGVPVGGGTDVSKIHDHSHGH